jgi:hypothetical protein
MRIDIELDGMQNPLGGATDVTVTATPDRVRLESKIDPCLASDGGGGQSWNGTMHSSSAAALAEELLAGRLGTHLYEAVGTYGPLDGEILDVLELGVSTESQGVVSLWVTVPQSRRADLYPRYEVAVLTGGEARRLCQALVGVLAAAG